MKLSKRLKSIASLVESNTSFIDVGCDHALLSIFLVLNKDIKRAIASDINDGPLLSAKDNIKRFGVDDKVETIKMDGISNLPSDINTIIISGMGASLIIDILSRGNLENVDTIVLSPNNDVELVRRSVSKLGYYIDKEDFVKDRGKYYTILVFKRGKMRYSSKEYKYGPYLIKNINNDYREYINTVLAKDREILNSLPKKYLFKIIKLKKEIKELSSL